MRLLNRHFTLMDQAQSRPVNADQCKENEKAFPLQSPDKTPVRQV